MAESIILVSGPCGAGKTSVSRLLAQNKRGSPAVHIHSDDFYHYIKTGYIPPWQKAAGDQNEVVMRAAAACAEQYAQGGYQVYVDGVIGPWFLKEWQRLSAHGLDLRYVVLRPVQETAVQRAMAREQRQEFPLQKETVQAMWGMFAQLGKYESHVVDNSGQSVQETAVFLQSSLAAGKFRL